MQWLKTHKTSKSSWIWPTQRGNHNSFITTTTMFEIKKCSDRSMVIETRNYDIPANRNTNGPNNHRTDQSKDRPTNLPTVRQGHREVSLQIKETSFFRIIKDMRGNKKCSDRSMGSEARNYDRTMDRLTYRSSNETDRPTDRPCVEIKGDRSMGTWNYDKLYLLLSLFFSFDWVWDENSISVFHAWSKDSILYFCVQRKESQPKPN